MTFHKAKREASHAVAAAKSDYLQVLGAVNIKQLEERVVSTILSSLTDQIEHCALPIRLSKIASQFLIEPRPQNISGSHDGQLEYDRQQNKFLIKLCGLHTSNSRVGAKRHRFTYAHEMAHRFFFVEHPDKGWMRAIDLVTDNLSATREVIYRSRLNDLEEVLCNRIAHRILVPDAVLVDRCKLNQWFEAQHALYDDLSRTANEFDVSRECLIVAISNAIQRKVVKPNANAFLMVIGKTRGPMNCRGKEALRIKVSSFPTKLDDCRVQPPFPGFELRRFGAEAEEFFERAIRYPADSNGAISIPILLKSRRSNQIPPPTKLIGWWKSFSVTPQHRRLCVWGMLAT